MSNTAIVLSKGGRINISKEAPGLKQVRFGMAWGENTSDTGQDFDLDVSMFACSNGRLLNDDNFLFYMSRYRSENGTTVFLDEGSYPRKGKPALPCLGAVHSGDDTTGGSSSGDDEIIAVDFSRLNPKIDELIFVGTIHDSASRKQNFGQVPNASATLYNGSTGLVLAKFDLGEDYSAETAIELVRIYKKDGEWRMQAVGTGYKQGLDAFVRKFGGNLA